MIQCEVKNAISKTFASKDSSKRKKNDLSLSFERMRRKTDFLGKIYVSNGKTVTIGNYCRLNQSVSLFGRRNCSISIGDRVTLSPGVTVLASGYDTDTWMRENKKVHTVLHTVIGDDVWICANAVIQGGIKIVGHHVIVAAGSVVTHDITESYC